MAAGKVSFGVLGCAGIADKHVRAMRLAGNIEVAACASRSLEKAQAWAAERGIPQAYGSYAELLDSPVQAVLIPLPTALRKEWVLKAAAKGKHVLMEKPTAVAEADLVDMIEACAAAGVQLMDCTMFVHHERTAQLRAIFQDPAKFGQVCSVQSAFIAPAHLGGDSMLGNIRAMGDLEPTGALGDMGWYNIRATLVALGYQLPTHVSCSSVVSTPQGAPMLVHGALYFAPAPRESPGPLCGPRVATFQAGYTSHWQSTLHVAGDFCLVSMEDFVLEEGPERVEYTVARQDLQDGAVIWKRDAEVVEVKGCQQEVRMVATFADLVLGGKPDPEWSRQSRTTQRVLDACAASMKAGGARVEVDQSPI